MEREILIANTKTQKRSKITSSAMTLGELKTDLRNAGIDYTGMTFTEGISKTQLLNDATQLPQNVMYKGQPTNNLVILLTNTKKNIASGAGSRKEAYEAIKDNDLAEDIKVAFGTNYTHVSTADLWDFINGNVGTIPEETKEENDTSDATEGTDDVDTEDYDEEEEETPYTIADLLTDERVLTIEDSIFHHIAMLANKKVLEAHHINSLIEDLKELLGIMESEAKAKSEPVSTSDGSIDDDDIDDMINDIL